MDELIVTNPKVLAKLPAGPSRTIVRWHWFWFSHLWRALLGQLFPTRPWAEQVAIVLRPISTRMANAHTYLIGPLEIMRPAPWLLGPALQLHPEAFRVDRA